MQEDKEALTEERPTGGVSLHCIRTSFHSKRNKSEKSTSSV
jgi:hypothetical protein